MNHTPGPWRHQEEKTSDFLDQSAKTKFQVYNVTGKFVHIATANKYADARLIAAAPDLLEAAKALLRMKKESESFLQIERAVDKAEKA